MPIFSKSSQKEKNIVLILIVNFYHIDSLTLHDGENVFTDLIWAQDIHPSEEWDDCISDTHYNSHPEQGSNQINTSLTTISRI